MPSKDLILVGNTGVLVSLNQIAKEWNISVKVFRAFCVATSIPFMVTDDNEFISVPALETVLFHLMMPNGDGLNLNSNDWRTGLQKISRTGTCSKESVERFALYSLAYAGGNQARIRQKVLGLARRLRGPGSTRAPLVKAKRAWGQRTPRHLHKRGELHEGQ